MKQLSRCHPSERWWIEIAHAEACPSLARTVVSVRLDFPRVQAACFSVLHNAFHPVLWGRQANFESLVHSDCTIVVSFVRLWLLLKYSQKFWSSFLHFCAFMMQYFTFLIKFVFSLWWWRSWKTVPDSSGFPCSCQLRIFSTVVWTSGPALTFVSQGAVCPH